MVPSREGMSRASGQVGGGGDPAATLSAGFASLAFGLALEGIGSLSRGCSVLRDRSVAGAMLAATSSVGFASLAFEIFFGVWNSTFGFRPSPPRPIAPSPHPPLPHRAST